MTGGPSHPAARGGRPVAGIRLGILTLASRHELVPGNVQHAGSFPFPTAYAVVENVPLPLLMAGDEVVLPAILEAVRTLETLGVDMIVGACGSFGHYQRDVAAAARMPVCLSPLVQVPFLLSILPSDRTLGIVFARTSAFTDKVKAQCGIVDTSRIVAVGADALDSFAPILDPDLRLDSRRLQDDMVGLLSETLTTHQSIGAWLLQCSDLPPYAAAIASATGLPVFDMATLAVHLEGALSRRDLAVRPA